MKYFSRLILSFGALFKGRVLLTGGKNDLYSQYSNPGIAKSIDQS